MIIFFGSMPKIYFFQLPKVNKICLGVELDPAYPTSCRSPLQNVIKKQKGHASR